MDVLVLWVFVFGRSCIFKFLASGCVVGVCIWKVAIVCCGFVFGPWLSNLALQKDGLKSCSLSELFQVN